MNTLTIPTCAALLTCVTLACGPESSGDTQDATTGTTSSTTNPATTTTTTEPTTTEPTSTSAPTSTGTDMPVDPCLQTPDPGPCDAGFEHYFFDPATKRCDQFSWGGCDGVVPFEDLASCQSACEPCEAFAGDVSPAPAHPAIPFAVRNDSAEPLFLRTYTPDSSALGFRDQTFEVREAGASEPLITVPSVCDFPCAHFDNAECATGCTDGGPPPPPILLSPGGVFTGSWSGLFFDTTSMPERCQPAACEGELECGRWFESFTTGHEVKVVIAKGWECLGPDCTCTANAEGWCQLPVIDGLGDPIGTQELTASFSFPGENTVELSFP